MPKGNVAYYWNDNGVDRMSVLSVETGAVTPFVTVGPGLDLALEGHGTNAHLAEWSPDGSKFAYIFAGGPNSLNVLRILENGNTRDLYSSDTGGGLSSPTWSSDGKRIAFIKMGSDKQTWSFIIIPSDGTKCTSDKFECLVKFATGEQYRGGLSWGKGNLLAISYNTTEPSEVYSIFADGQGALNLTKNPADDTAPAWSPDGKLIAFASNREGAAWKIFVMNADGSGVRRLTEGPMDFTPTWSPDGNWIAFASARGGAQEIWMVDIHGGNYTLLSKGGGSHPVWTR